MGSGSWCGIILLESRHWGADIADRRQTVPFTASCQGAQALYLPCWTCAGMISQPVEANPDIAACLGDGAGAVNREITRPDPRL